MSGKEILVDTNIILHLINGSEDLVTFLEGKDVFISFITELELLGYKGISAKQETQIVELLDDCSIISMNKLIREKYIFIKRNYNVKLPDAIIIATAMAFDMPIISADKDFKRVKEIVDNSILISYDPGLNLT